LQAVRRKLVLLSALPTVVPVSKYDGDPITVGGLAHVSPPARASRVE
jgi:hypothetical protein